MLTLAQFRTQFPEFNTAASDLVQSRLDMSSKRLDPVVWGNRYDEGHGLLTAHLLAISPYGQMARLTATGGKAGPGVARGASTYGQEFDRLVVIVAGLSLRVL